MHLPASTIEEPKEHYRDRSGLIGVDREVVFGDTRTVLFDLASCQAVGVYLFSSVNIFPGQIYIGVMI